MMTKLNLKHPHMRIELISYLRELSDLEYQKQNWLPENSKNGIPSSQFGYSVHFLFDDTALATDPESCVGWFLRDQKEVEVIRLVTSSIDQVFDKHGAGLSDIEYMKTAEWSDVLKTSEIALARIGVAS